MKIYQTRQEGRLEDYTSGRNIEIERVKEIYRLFKKHGFKLAGLRSFGKYITEEDVAQKRLLAEEMRANTEKSAQVKRDSAEALAKIPVMSKGVGRSEGQFRKWALLGGSISTAMLGMYVLGRRKRS